MQALCLNQIEEHAEFWQTCCTFCEFIACSGHMTQSDRPYQHTEHGRLWVSSQNLHARSVYPPGSSPMLWPASPWITTVHHDRADRMLACILPVRGSVA